MTDCEKERQRLFQLRGYLTANGRLNDSEWSEFFRLNEYFGGSASSNGPIVHADIGTVDAGNR